MERSGILKKGLMTWLGLAEWVMCEVSVFNASTDSVSAGLCLTLVDTSKCVFPGSRYVGQSLT